MNLCPLVWNVKSPPTLKEINEMINKGFVSVGKQNLPLVTSVCTCWFFFFFYVISTPNVGLRLTTRRSSVASSTD